MCPVALQLWLAVGAVQAGTPSSAPPVFELCAERVEATRIESAEATATVHVRLTESATRDLVGVSGLNTPVDVRAGELSFARFIVRDPLRDQPPRRVDSVPMSREHARAVERAIERPCL